MLEPIEYTGADIVIDAFLEQHTVLVFKYDLRYLEDFGRNYLFCRILVAFIGPYGVIEVFSSGNPPGKAVTVSTPDIASVRKLLENKKL